MNFERGQNVKESLDLGMEPLLRKFLKSVHQLTNNRRHQLNILVRYSQENLVRYLILEKGISPDSLSLKIAVKQGNLGIIKLILQVDESLKTTLSITPYRFKHLPEEMRELLKW